MTDDYILNNGSGGITGKGCGRHIGQLHSYNYLEGVPGSENDTDYVEVQFKNTRKGFFLNSNKLPLETKMTTKSGGITQTYTKALGTTTATTTEMYYSYTTYSGGDSKNPTTATSRDLTVMPPGQIYYPDENTFYHSATYCAFLCRVKK